MIGKEIMQEMGIENKVINSKLSFEDVCRQMADTYNRKNHDYGNSFDKSLDKWGLVAAATRIGDKMNRFETLIKNDAKVKDESLADTCLDAATYFIMTYLWLNK